MKVGNHFLSVTSLGFMFSGDHRVSRGLQMGRRADSRRQTKKTHIFMHTDFHGYTFGSVKQQP
jgi:hypothetical protein